MPNFMSMRLPVFLSLYPGAMTILPPGLDLKDPNYIVRMNDLGVEIGYDGDDWKLVK